MDLDKLNSEIKLLRLQLKMTEAKMGDLLMIYETAKEELERREILGVDSNE